MKDVEKKEINHINKYTNDVRYNQIFFANLTEVSKHKLDKLKDKYNTNSSAVIRLALERLFNVIDNKRDINNEIFPTVGSICKLFSLLEVFEKELNSNKKFYSKVAVVVNANQELKFKELCAEWLIPNSLIIRISLDILYSDIENIGRDECVKSIKEVVYTIPNKKPFKGRVDNNGNYNIRYYIRTSSLLYKKIDYLKSKYNLSKTALIRLALKRLFESIDNDNSLLDSNEFCRLVDSNTNGVKQQMKFSNKVDVALDDKQNKLVDKLSEKLSVPRTVIVRTALELMN